MRRLSEWRTSNERTKDVKSVQRDIREVTMEENISKYRNAVSIIKQAILQSQYRAAKLVNGEQLSLYFGIGCYVSANSRKGTWGTGAIDRISEQLRKELPGLRGFSASSIKDMRSFYEYWQQFINRRPSAVDLQLSGDSCKVLLTLGDAYALPFAECFSGFQPENTEQSLKHSTNLHRTPCTSYNDYYFYPKSTKNCRSSERNFKNRP